MKCRCKNKDLPKLTTFIRGGLYFFKPDCGCHNVTVYRNTIPTTSVRLSLEEFVRNFEVLK